MSARSFRSVFMVASCAGAALGCYLVSLNVASERAALEEVETKIVLAQRDIRLLQTEIGTRGRLAQLERWNVRVLALSAPSADQFLEGGFQLARLARPEQTPAVEAPVVLASVPAPQPRSVPLEEGEHETGGAGATGPAAVPAARLLREASLKVPVREVPAALAQPRPVEKKAVEAPRKAPEKAPEKTATKPSVEARKAPAKKAGDKTAVASGKAVTKPVRTANADPLAPLPTAVKSRKTAKDSGSAQ